MKIYRLEELCKDIIDCPHITPEWKKSGIPVIRNFNLDNGHLNLSEAYFVDEETYYKRTSRAIPEEGDIIISREAPMGVVAIIPPNFKCCLGQRLVLLKVDKYKCNPYLLLYLLMSDYVQTQFQRANSTGSIVSNLCIPDLKNIKVPIPEGNQQEITNLLQKIDKKIENNNAINNNLEQQAMSLYDYWFTQYNFTDECGNPYCFSGGKMVWNEQLKRKIPENWTVKCVLDILSWQSNSQPPKSDFVYEKRDGYVRFIQNRDYDSDEYITYIPKTKSITTCNRKDILIDKYGDAGKVRYGIDGAFNVALAKLNLHDKDLQEYVRCYFETKPIYNYLHSSCMASTRASLNESNIGNLYIAIPPKSVLNMFNLFINPIRDSILLLKDENRKLISLRNFLLPMLMNGQATIKE